MDKVLIDIKDGILFIEVGDRLELLTRYRTFFEIVNGFQRDISNRCYTLDDKNQIRTVLGDTISFLKDKKIDFTISTEAIKLVKKSEEEYDFFIKSRESGEKIKRTRLNPFPIPEFMYLFS